MRKFVSTILLAAIVMGSCTACKSSPKLDFASFEKYALNDLKIEKKDVSAQDTNAYYDLDYMINDTDETPRKRDHTAQVYSTAAGSTTSSLVMIYTDYQDANEAKAFFEELIVSEESMLATVETSERDSYKTEKGKDYFLVLSTQNDLNWRYECVYYQKDVILFVNITIGTSDINNINKEWLANAKKFFSDVGIQNPFKMTPDIDKIA